MMSGFKLNMKKICWFFLFIQLCFADDNATMYGTSDNPQINGVQYDVHKLYIEPNPGYGTSTASNQGVDQAIKPSQVTIAIRQGDAATHKTASSNLESDQWASNSSVERVLKQAASEGKLDYVLGQAKKANVPASVAIVPIVESKYNKNAVSPKGAGGAWQLMPATANDYGLSSQGRFDFHNSTDVAIQILSDSYQQFGNWSLAFAAYNCGNQCVLSALKKNPNAKDIEELSLPSETKDYVKQIVQWTQILAGLDKTNKSTIK